VVFFGLGSDGMVGTNNNTIKIIGTETDNYSQGYFVYDSKKSGAMTMSHLPLDSNAREASYLIEKVDFVANHQYTLFEYSGSYTICGEISYLKLLTQMLEDRLLLENAKDVLRSMVEICQLPHIVQMLKVESMLGIIHNWKITQNSDRIANSNGSKTQYLPRNLDFYEMESWRKTYR
jgi:Pyruvate/2-oxoacid:ferredoxin oxidoreductase gamma subunit